ncbi:hypothetical protein DFP72DRAFT_325482 [Ephemerocybe angulata]|uniref:Uncharacterized protein n=1 Tax=Ephemerocybe angulata TaxID=980116 RepID=A0A8H6IIN7_9AGAR|nr:hypothetical protein DFP72DRAFT_325482 [Tulosesus angulatus]
MESIKSAYLSLKNGATKSKSKANKDVNSTIDKLSDVLDILKLSTVSDTVFLKLSNLLRQTIQPLYEHELDLTLNLSSAIFLAVHNVKVVTSVDRASRKTWENVQSSVLSGLLDHLDEHRTAKTKASVGKAFFTSLSKLYFPKSPEQRVDCSSDLHTTVFMLLSEIVCGQSANASTLRNELNGGRRLGYAILNLRDFLPLEAALELFANILLALRGANSRSERLKFTQYVFDSQFFSSPTLLGGLAKITSADQWSDISSEVMKTIASLNAEFPQPFEISDFQLKGFKSRGPDNIFLESTAVVGSIPVPGGDDTLIIPFPFISGLQMASSGGEAVVKVSLNAPPIIGKKPVNCDLEDIFVEWKVQKQDIKRFSETLKSRKVPFDFSNFQHSRKLSIAQKGLSLEFNGSEDGPPPNATQEKAISIAKLWDESEAHRGVGQTSPLMHAIFPPSTGDAKGRPPVPVCRTFGVHRQRG